MNNAKDKRIKKLKRKRIWPSVIGLFVLLSIMCLLSIIIMGASIVDIMQRKVNQSLARTEKIASLYEDYNDSNAKDINENVEAYIKISDEIGAVALVDKEGNPIWISGGEYPALDNLVDFDVTYGEEVLHLKLIIVEGENQIFKIDNNELVIDDNILNSIKINNLSENNIFSENDANVIMHLNQWFLVPVGDIQVLVFNDVNLYGYEIIMPIMIGGLIIVLMLIFAIYYLVSVISVFVNMRKMTRLIYTDVVTGGNNWLHFVKKGTSLLKKNRKGKFNYAVLHLQMRKYRSFCTCLGVRRGEELIESFYNVLKKKLGTKEVMVHHENAQFAILLKYTDKQQLLNRISEIEKELDAVLPNMKLYFGVGVYQVEVGEKDIEQLYNNALIACEMLSEEADNQIAFFDVEMNKRKMWERKVEDDMDKALQNKEFKVYLQPKISARGEMLAGAEALVRWIHPSEGFIPPNRFIPIFEQNGFILKLDDYMLEEIAAQQAQWISEGKEVVPISVNVSRAHFTREDLAEHICTIVDKYNVPHNVIELELTESAFFDDKKVLLNTVNKLRDVGFIVSMDDFGAGYSSLNSLKELKIDVLKIDADFFRGASEQERGMLIVSEVIDLAKKLNMKIVAEGIESREQVDFLVEQECDLIQGYFYAKPMPISDFVKKYGGSDE